MRLTTVLFVAAALAWAQPAKLPEPYQSIVELSHAVPPEFASDALLRIVESNQLADRDSKRRLTEDAFRLAEVATLPARMRALPGIPQDSRSSFLGRAYGLQLDALLLESRAATDMLAIDVPKARELFGEIPPPSVAPLSCDDALVYDLSNFYQALGAMASLGFSEKERTKQDHVNFLLGYLAQATSPLQFPPLADLIRTVNVTPAQREALWIRFNGLVENTRPDGRSFSALLADRDHAPAQLQVFFDKNKGAGCPDDAVGLKSGSTPKLDLYWQSPQAQQLLQDGRKLRFTSNKQPLSDADRSTPEWRGQLADYLNELANWGPAQEKSEADYFHQKCQVFVNLIDLIPDGSDRDVALAAFVEFINTSTLEWQSPVEWYLEASSMLDRVQGERNGEANKVREAFEGSGNPVLALSDELENVFGRKTPEWLTPQGTFHP